LREEIFAEDETEPEKLKNNRTPKGNYRKSVMRFVEKL
jgi:hypothetical protein